MTDFRISTIAVVGCGAPLAMAAALLGSQLRQHNVRIVAIALPRQEVAPVGESTGPEVRALHAMLGLRETVVSRATDATFKLGYSACSDTDEWFVPYGRLGLQLNVDGLEQLVQKYLATSPGRFDHFVLAAQAARYGRFAVPGDDRPELQESLAHGLHLDMPAYEHLLTEVGLELGVTYCATEALGAVERDDSGFVRRVFLSTGENIAADFWVDCAPGAPLFSGVNANSWESWNHFPLPDTQVSLHAAGGTLNQPYTSLQEVPGGWLKRIPLQRYSTQEVYWSSSACEWADIEHYLVSKSDIDHSPVSWRVISPGAFQDCWHNNVLAVGSAAVELVGLFHSQLSLTQAALVQFLDMFPDKRCEPHNTRAFNDVWRSYVQDARDFVVAHCCDLHNESQRNLPPSLQKRLQLFRRLGKVPAAESDAVRTIQWYSLFNGRGMRPELGDVRLSRFDSEHMNSMLEPMVHHIVAIAKGMPPHAEFVRRFCRSTSASSKLNNS